ncbi:hypothetical protein, partial [Prevotella sp.]|uniref:hypothetical protein n=1 Tax=Prevotella sp. TaxID=59823 RepID=UPI0025E13E66
RLFFVEKQKLVVHPHKIVQRVFLFILGVLTRPQGGGALWASSFDVYIQKKRTTRITRTGLSKNNVNQCPILSNMNKI